MIKITNKLFCYVMDCLNLRPNEETILCKECYRDWLAFAELNGIDSNMEQEDIIDYLYHFLRVNMKE